MKKAIFASLISLLMLGSTQAQTIDSKNSYIQFEVKNMGKTVEGTMKNMEGTVQFNPQDLSNSSFEATVAPSTVETGSKGRDKHLQKEDYFGVEEYGTIQMTSQSIQKTAQGYEAKATLTIKDIQTEVTVPFVVKEEADRQILEGNLEVMRKDYGLGEDMGKMMIGLEVQVKIYAEVLK